MVCHGPPGLARWPGPVRQCRAWGIRGVALGFNPNPPLLSCAPHLLLEISIGFPPRRLLRLDAPHRRSASASFPSSPLHHRPHPLPPWPSRSVRKIPSPRSMNQAARFHEVGEAANDSTPDGASEWWLFTCDIGILWWCCGARGTARRWWWRGGDWSA
jgi:hypothetical protein